MRTPWAIVLSLIVCATSMEHALAEEGLFKIKDTKVPGSIEIASESVVQIVLSGGSPQKIPQTAYENYLNAQPGENFILYLVIQKVKDCKAHGLSECEVSYTSYGSGFLTDDGLSLWSARHVLAPQLNTKSLSIEIYNSAGEKIFDTTDRKDQATIALVGSSELIQKKHPKILLDDEIKTMTSDYIKLRLNHSLAVRALQISQKKSKLGDRVYTAGYANVSARSLTSTGNVQSRSRVAIGVVTPYADANSSESPEQKQQRLNLEDFLSQHMLVMDLDGLPGQSGSPILNESGEVVGIFTAGNGTISGRRSLRGLGPHFEGIVQNGQ